VLRTEPVAAVILDLQLWAPPGLSMSGFDLLSIMRGTPEYACVPVVILTGKTLSPVEHALARQWDVPVFQKPQRYAVVIDYLKTVVRPELIHSSNEL